ncbi:MAG: DHHA1 domain-containing protein [Candidatus Aenigmarchaeota archaeon]|nr:DHHA1 domain-containing protein [Candidatus Aenigmarchaeota archaeon]
MKYMKEAVEFLKDIKKTDETVIVFNNDGDGICSCTIVIKLMDKLGLRSPYLISQPMPMDKNLVNRIKTTVPNKIIFLDLVVDQQEDIIKKVRGFADILAVDHHKITKNMNEKNVVYYNPRMTKSSLYQSTSYCAYKIAEEITEMPESLWISAVGIVSDYNLEDSKDIVEMAKKKFNVNDLYDSFLGRIADMISASRATNVLSCEEVVELFIKLEDPEKLEDTEKGRKLADSYNTIKNEMFSILEDIKSTAEKKGKVIMYNLKSPYNLSSPISTKASEMYMDELLLVYNRSGTKYKVSARNQNKNIDAGKVMTLACKGIKASGGGHEAAAGATIDEKDWERFKENVFRIVNKE